MHTMIERAELLIDLLVNGTATQDQRDKALEAFGSAQEMVETVKQVVITRVNMHERRKAMLAVAPPVVEFNDVAP